MKQCSNVTPKSPPKFLRNLGGLTGQATNRGFTIIELLVVISIIVILTGVVLASYRAGEQQLTLQRAANKLAQDIRRVQEMTMSAKEIWDPVQGKYIVPEGGYGVYLKDATEVDRRHYILFADKNGNGSYESGQTEKIEDIKLEKGIKIGSLSPSPLIIIFTPPDPTVIIVPTAAEGSVTLINNGQFKTISVNEVGMINID